MVGLVLATKLDGLETSLMFATQLAPTLGTRGQGQQLDPTAKRHFVIVGLVHGQDFATHAVDETIRDSESKVGEDITVACVWGKASIVE